MFRVRDTMTAQLASVSDSHRRRRGFAAALLLALLIAVMLASPSTAQEPLSVNVTNVDLDGFPEISAVVQIGGPAALTAGALDPSAFTVEVDGAAVEALEVRPTSTEPAPTATLLLIDESGSMRGAAVEEARTAARRYVDAMRPVDLVAIYAFNEEWRLLHDFSSDRAALAAALADLAPRRETALYDGVSRSLQALAGAPDVSSRYLVVLSDGGDTASVGALEDTLALVRASGVQLYAVGLKGNEFDPAPLIQLAEASGGRYLEAPTPADLSALYVSLAKEIQNQYVVSLRAPDKTNATGAGAIAVSVAAAGVSASGERGFFYPEASSPPATAPVTTPTTAPEENATVQDPASALPTKTLAARLVGWNGSDYGVALIAAFLLFLAFLVIHRVLFPKRDILSEYADILENRRNLAPVANEAERQGAVSSMVGRVLSARGYAGPLQSRIEDAGWSIRSSEFFLLQLALIAGPLLVLALFGAPLWSMLAFAILAVFVPLALLDNRARKRRTAFENQVPDTLILMANSLRAGQGFEQALQVVADEGADPMSHEFRRLLAQQRLGVSPEETLRTLADRMGSEAFDWVVLATSIQREVGGNLAEIYDRIADTLRQRQVLRGEIKTLTAEGNLSAFILILLPFGVGGATLVLNNEYASLLYTTRPGIIMLLGSVVAMTLGVVWLRRIIRFDV